MHGCLDEFKTLRRKINPTQRDREILVGDILNGGPHSRKLLKYIRKNNIESVMGNHELSYLLYKRNQNDFHDYKKIKTYEKLKKKDFKYIESLPFFIKIDNLVIVHAGITNKIKLNRAKIEDLEKLSSIIYLNEHNITKLWNKHYNGNQGIIVYGHKPSKSVKIDKFSIGIDTGCVYGGQLTAVIINNTKQPLLNYKIESVKALNSYARHRLFK